MTRSQSPTIIVTPSTTKAAKVPELVSVAPTPDTPLLYVAVRASIVAVLTKSKVFDIFFAYPLLTTWVSVDGSFDDTIFEKVGVLVVAILWGRDSVTDPVEPDATTWFAVPVSDITPEFEIVIFPIPFVTPTPVPAVRVLSVYPDPFPINTCPLLGVVLSPVPPELIGSG